MIADARSLPNGTSLTTRVCIVGGGPAGLTVADGLARAGIDTILLESGGDHPDPAPQRLNDGEIAGEALVFEGTPQRLTDTRLRYLGGTSNHWTGMCRPHDLDVHPGLPESGWPLTPADLEPFYERAAATCELASTHWEEDWWRDELGQRLLTDATPQLATAVHQFSPPVRFGERFRPALQQSPHVQALLWANVTELITPADGSHVRAARVRTFAGTELTVAADVFVLAAGGIETPRLLLASEASSPAGVANRHDLVGRTFMEHPHVIGGRAHLATTIEDLGFYRLAPVAMPPDGAPQHVWAGLSPTADARREARIGAGTVFLWAAGDGPPRGDRDEASEAAAAAAALTAPAGGPTTEVTLSIRTEQQPNPDSRISLLRARDELGMRRVSLDWHLTDLDWQTVDQTVRLVALSLGQAGLGRVEVAPGGRALRSFQVGVGNHHMGTVRMHDDPRRGVVDRFCRAHEVDNLYVCSSAVFPTAGSANPTLTIVALAHRLVDHLIASR